MPARRARRGRPCCERERLADRRSTPCGIPNVADHGTRTAIAIAVSKRTGRSRRDCRVASTPTPSVSSMMALDHVVAALLDDVGGPNSCTPGHSPARSRREGTACLAHTATVSEETIIDHHRRPHQPGDRRRSSRRLRPRRRCRHPLRRSRRGPLVLLLHGFPGSGTAGASRSNRSSSAGFRVVAPDLRGYNLSSQLDSFTDYTADKPADDIRGLIRELGDESALVVGHDWADGRVDTGDEPPGGRRSPRNPQRGASAQAQRRPEDPHQLLRSWYFFYFQFPWLPERRARAGTGASSSASCATPARRTRRGARSLRRGLVAARGGQGDDRLLPRRRALGSKQKVLPISAPTLVIWGQGDRYLGAQLAEPHTEDVPNLAASSASPNASHWVHHDEAERVNELLVGTSSRRPLFEQPEPPPAQPAAARLRLSAMSATRLPGFLGRTSERQEARRTAGERAGRARARSWSSAAKRASTRRRCLRYTARQASGFRVAQVSGVEAEMELPFSGIHQLCAADARRAQSAATSAAGRSRRRVGACNRGPTPRWRAVCSSVRARSDGACTRCSPSWRSTRVAAYAALPPPERDRGARVGDLRVFGAKQSFRRTPNDC